jgi:hypothetical protein
MLFILKKPPDNKYKDYLTQLKAAVYPLLGRAQQVLLSLN